MSLLLIMCIVFGIGTRSQDITGGQGPILNEFIRHFEPLYFDCHAFQEQHRRAKRSPKSEIRLEFAAHSRVFKLRMRPDKSIFAADVIFESTGGEMAYDTSNVLQGSLEDEEDSSATGVFTAEGLFDGVVRSRREEFYIEPARRYFTTPRRFHSVIYRVADVHFPPGRNHTGCRSQLLHRKMIRRRRVWVGDDVQGSVDRQVRVRKASRTMRYKDEQGSDSEPYGVRSVQRTHWSDDRTERHVVIDPKKTTCMLYLQADHLFFHKMGSEEACIETMTRHVQKVNSIYKTTDFDQDGRPDNISFLIKRIKVHSSPKREVGYRFPGNYGVEKFLELFSEEDYDSFCLAYMFTYRDFEGGTLGLAWTGDLKNAGGVCEKNGHYRGSLKSLNTGIVTLLNYGKHVPPIVSHVTLAHEIGHNFGSPHDPEDDRFCTPGGENGNYIMFARATSGDKKNNNRFSPCSLKSINSVLNTKARSVRGCFTEPQDAICGNEVVEGGEECDCGWEEDCSEPCCFPMRANPPPSQPPCRLRPNVICSPSQGPCCTSDCLLKLGDKCRDDNGCRSSSFCDGNGPKCPPSINKPNKTICNAEFVCYMGECTGSICVAYGLESCQCKRSSRDLPTKSCELCCKHPGDDRSCKSSFEWNSSPYDVPDMFAKPGTPCDNYNGYCDVFQKCREVDPSGPLATLRKLLLSNESMASLKLWLLGHWWGVLLLCLGAMLLLFVAVKMFGRKQQQKSSKNESSQTTFFRSTSNHALAKARAQQQTTATAHSVAALSCSSAVKTSLSSQSDKPLALSGNGWV